MNKKRALKMVLALAALVWLGVGVYNFDKPLFLVICMFLSFTCDVWALFIE